MRVVLAHPYRWPEVRRGGERYVNGLAHYLRGSGHDVEVVVLGRSTPGFRGVPDWTAPVARHTSWTAVDRFGFSALPALLRRADVVHAFVPSAAVVASALRHQVVYTLLGEPTTELLGRGQGRGRLVRSAVRRSTIVTALSDASARSCRQLLGREAVTLPPGVDLSVFAEVPGPRTGQPTILYNADLSVRRKGLDTLLAAAARLLTTMPDLRVVLSGPGDASWAWDALSADDRRAVRPSVDDLGPGTPEEVPRRYAGAWVTALPAAEEAFGLTLVESLATGTPVVCGPGGAAEVVSAEVGRVVAPGRPQALAVALSQALDLARRPGVSASCRAAAARFGWSEAVGPGHEAVYEQAVRR